MSSFVTQPCYIQLHFCSNCGRLLYIGKPIFCFFFFVFRSLPYRGRHSGNHSGNPHEDMAHWNFIAGCPSRRRPITWKFLVFLTGHHLETVPCLREYGLVRIESYDFAVSQADRRATHRMKHQCMKLKKSQTAMIFLSCSIDKTM